MKYDFYFAAALFSQAERDFNKQLVEKIRRLGFSVFLPQEEGFKSPLDTFELNKSNLDDSESLIVICDGADMDSGTAWETGYFYCKEQGSILTFRTDFRYGADDPAGFNLMIAQSADEIFFHEVELFEHLKGLIV